MNGDKYNYFISYATTGGIFNTEVSWTEILNIDSIREIEEEIKKDIHSDQVQIINYRMF